MCSHAQLLLRVLGFKYRTSRLHSKPELSTAAPADRFYTRFLGGWQEQSIRPLYTYIPEYSCHSSLADAIAQKPTDTKHRLCLCLSKINIEIYLTFIGRISCLSLLICSFLYWFLLFSRVKLVHIVLENHRSPFFLLTYFSIVWKDFKSPVFLLLGSCPLQGLSPRIYCFWEYSCYVFSRMRTHFTYWNMGLIRRKECDDLLQKKILGELLVSGPACKELQWHHSYQ